MNMKHLDLFSGIGGFALAASWVWGDEHNITSFVEIDPFCQKVLKKHWPDVPIISDIRDVTHERIMADTEQFRCENNGELATRERTRPKQKGSHIIKVGNNEPQIDLLTGGFPCQPFSCAGKRQGDRDDRFLWPEMLRVIREVQPTWIIGENVAGITNLALDQVLSELENEGYACQSFIIPACAVDAPHRRDRVWIVANSQEERPQGRLDMGKEQAKNGGLLSSGSNKRSAVGIVADAPQELFNGPRRTGPERGKEHSNSGKNGVVGKNGWLPEPNVGRVAHGIPNRVDRLKSLGNSIVPQVVVPIMQAIKEIDKNPF